MKLNIVNTSDVPVWQQFGITEERMNEIADHLDVIVNKWLGKKALKAHVFQDIAAICNNIEEYTAALDIHYNYHLEEFGTI